jgi:glycosyltransferase involved in cell wall biosynthesis
MTPGRGRGPALAMVLWGGYVGGAERLSIALAERLRKLGAEVTMVYLQEPWSLAGLMSAAGVPHRSLGFARGRDAVRHPRRYARVASEVGGDGALLLDCGVMGGALRAGGYRAPIVAVEHGDILGLSRRSLMRRLLWRVGRLSGAWADDAEVAVSDFMLDEMGRHSHARRVQRIYNGIDPDTYAPRDEPDLSNGTDLIVGFAGRLIAGKGADRLIRAVAEARERVSVRLVIAGDGPERSHLESIANALALGTHVEFLGVVDDAPAFWRSCDIAAVPSDTFVESFSMTTLEAMASGSAIVASRNGAIPELMLDGVTGTLVEPGDVRALTQALVTYAEQPELRSAHAAAARARAVERFQLEDCARAHLDLFRELAGESSVRR